MIRANVQFATAGAQDDVRLSKYTPILTVYRSSAVYVTKAYTIAVIQYTIAD